MALYYINVYLYNICSTYYTIIDSQLCGQYHLNVKKKCIISEEDLAIFHQAMKGAKPLIKPKARVTKTTTPKKKSPIRYEEPEERINLSDSLVVDQVQSEEFIAFKQASVSNKILRKLRKGQYNVEAKLDLHGLSVEQARSAVQRFLQRCADEKIRVALIIHGKGHHSQMPILKNKINHWLRELNCVLAFCSAAPADGSRGAIYVLLKREE